MDVQFCDLCNESVPKPDVRRGKAVKRKGRLICGNCESAMSSKRAERSRSAKDSKESGASEALAAAAARGAREGRPSRRRRGKSALLVASMALLCGLVAMSAVAIGWFTVQDQMATDRLAVRAAESRFEGIANREAVRVSASLSDRLDDVDTSQLESRMVMIELKERLDRLIDGQEAKATRSAEELVRLNAGLSRMDRIPEDLARMSGELATVAQTQTEFFQDIRLLRDRIQRLEVDGVARAQVATPDPAVSAPVDPADAWRPVLAELESENAGTRWEAVQKLGDTRDSDVVPHLSKHIGDQDLFVRMAVARVLGDLGSLEACPALIEGLEDEEASVREAAVVSLRALAGKDFRFDPMGKPADRNKRVKEWRNWWQKEGSGMARG